MDFSNLHLLLPQIILSLTLVALLVQICVKRSSAASRTITFAGILLSFTSSFYVYLPSTESVTHLFIVSPMVHFFSAICLLVGFTLVMLNRNYSHEITTVEDEFYFLVVSTLFGATLLIAASHAVSVFLGLEIMSLSLVGMLAYYPNRKTSLEASMKYLLLSGAASSTFLLGVALAFATTGSLSIDTLFSQTPDSMHHLQVLGFCLFLAGLAFKLSLVPFHWWTPDVYHGAPNNAVMMLATVSKTAVFILLLRVMSEMNTHLADATRSMLMVMAVASMILGNLLALIQTNLKRVLAYSAIAHMGYVLVAAIVSVEARNPLAMEGSSYYLLAYVISSLICFGVLMLLSQLKHESDCEQLPQITGLFWQHPWLATAFAFALFSLAGIPITIGFIGKFYLLSLAVELRAWWLISAMIIGSAVGLYYYLRIIFSLFEKQPNGRDIPSFGSKSQLWVGALSITLIVLGVLPGILGNHLAFILK